MNLPHRFKDWSEIDGKVFIPSIQRDLMPTQVDKMKTHIIQRKSVQKEPIFGAIDIVNFNNKLYCIDGQHRLKALEDTYKINNISVAFTCMIYTADTAEELQLIFKTRNMGIPLPDFLLNTDNNKKELLKEIQREISVKKGFETSKANRPYINITIYMNNISNSKIIESLTSIDDFRRLYDYINAANKVLVADIKYRKKLKITDNMVQKWYEFDNYHGIDLNFPYYSSENYLSTLNSFLSNVKVTAMDIDYKDDTKSETFDKSHKIERIKFTAAQRQQIWHTHIGASKGQILCPLCRINTIEPLNYVIAHVISLNNGGNNDIENLRPLCSICNSSMSSKNLDLEKYSIEGI
jgi:hypothetical protein